MIVKADQMCAAALQAAVAISEPREWHEARFAAMRAIDQAMDKLAYRYGDGHITADELVAGSCALAGAQLQIGSKAKPDWLAERPPRRMPSPVKAARYWQRLGGPFSVDEQDPRCFACGLPVDAWGDLERAHLIDRWCGGLDHEAAMVMLCSIW